MAMSQEEDSKPPTSGRDARKQLSEKGQDRGSSTDVDDSRDALAEKDDVADSGKNTKVVEADNKVHEPADDAGASDAPPLPDESIPPLPTEAPPETDEQDDGWEPVWDETAQAFYFYNRFTGVTQWTNPRVPEAPVVGPPGVEQSTDRTNGAPVAGGYNPAIHGDYDPTAWYAQQAAAAEEQTQTSRDPADAYAATAAFNRFTGRFQNPDLKPENFNDENKSRRQLNAFFDVDAAANSHDGRSLKEERSGKKLSKAELKWHKEKRKAKKEEKRRAWLRD